MIHNEEEIHRDTDDGKTSDSPTEKAFITCTSLARLSHSTSMINILLLHLLCVWMCVHACSAQSAGRGERCNKNKLCLKKIVFITIKNSLDHSNDTFIVHGSIVDTLLSTMSLCYVCTPVITPFIVHGFPCALDFRLPPFKGVAINSDLVTNLSITEVRDTVQQKKRKGGKSSGRKRERKVVLQNTKESGGNKESRRKLGFEQHIIGNRKTCNW